MRNFPLGTYLLAIAIFLPVPVIRKTLCLDSPMFLDGYVAVQRSLGEEFDYKDLTVVK
jgi:hypothetical protein